MVDPFAQLFGGEPEAPDPFADLFETPEERQRRLLRERLRRNAAFGAEQAARLDLPVPAGEEPGSNPLLRRVGVGMLSGAAGMVSQAAKVQGIPIVPEFAGAVADRLQQTAGWEHPGGKLRDEYIAYQLSQGASPFGAAVAEGIASLADTVVGPEDLFPGLGALGTAGAAGQRFARVAPSPEVAARRALRPVPAPPPTSPLPQALQAPPAAVSGASRPSAAEALPELRELQGALARGELEPAAAAARLADEGGVAEAMAHAGSGASPEAASRIAGGTRFYEVSPSGDVRPMIGQDAVDARPRRGYVKVRRSPNGEVIVEEGRLTEVARRRLGEQLGEAPAPRRVLPDEPDVYELDLDLDPPAAALAADPPPPRSGAPLAAVRGQADPIRDGFLEKYAGKAEEKPPAESWLRRAANRFYEEVVNREDPVERFASASGNPEIARLVQRQRGAREISRGPLERGTARLDPERGEVVYTGEPLRGVLAGLDGEGLSDLDGLLMARRHLELAERQKSRGASALLEIDPEATRDASAYVGHLGQKLGPQGLAEMEQRAARVSAWSQRAILEPLNDVGLISPESLAAMQRAGSSYAPFMRLVDDTETVLTGSGASFVKPIKRGLTASSRVSSPLEELVLKSQRVQQWVEAQRVRNALADAVDANPELALRHELRPAKPGEFAKGETFSAWRNGESAQYRASPEVMRALDQVGSNGDASLLLKAASFPARMLRSGATLTLEFIARNPLRDQFTAGLVSRYGYVPFYDLAKGFFHASPMGRRISRLYDEYLDSGASISAMASVDRPHAAQGVRTLAGAGTAARVRKFIDGWRREGLLYPLQLLSGATERGSRVGAFARARSKGASHLDAMAEAREITLDFGRSGRSGRVANSLYAFLNAEIQDIDKVARAFKERPVATSVKALGYITMPAVAHHALWRSDPEYQTLPEWEKATYYHVGKLDDGRFVRFPRPIGSFALLAGYGVQKFLEYAESRDPEALSQLAERVSSGTILRYGTDLGELAPTGLRPAVEVSAGPGGWDYWRERPVVPRGLQGVDPAMQSFEDTPQVLQDLGAATGISPLKAEHMVRGYTAGLGTTAMDILDYYYREARGVDQPPPRATSRVPLVKGFVSASPFGFHTAPVDAVYERTKAAEMASKTYDRLRREDPAGSIGYRRQHPDIQRLAYLRRLRQRLNDLRKRRERIRTMAHTTPEWRAEHLLQIDQTVTHYAHQGLEKLED